MQEEACQEEAAAPVAREPQAGPISIARSQGRVRCWLERLAPGCYGRPYERRPLPFFRHRVKGQLSFPEITMLFNAKHGSNLGHKAVKDAFNSASHKLRIIIEARGLSFDTVLFGDRVRP